MQRIFWSINGALAGVLLGHGLFMLTIAGQNQKLGIVVLAVGISHAIVSTLGYKKYVGKGLLCKKDE